MSWNKLAPIARSSGRPMASATVEVNKTGEAKIAVILSGSLKDEFGARQVQVRGAIKVMSHLMFGVLVQSAGQLMRLIQ